MPATSCQLMKITTGHCVMGEVCMIGKEMLRGVLQGVIIGLVYKFRIGSLKIDC